VPLARRAADVVNIVETAKAEGDVGSELQVHAAELFRRTGLI
jgi:hypothetical protein